MSREGEKPSYKFLALEKQNTVSKKIVELIKEDGNTITGTQSILNEQTQFYKDLFSSQGNSQLDNSRYEQYLTNLPKLSETKKQILEEQITYEEVTHAILRSKNNKAPGPDGYTNKFLKIFIKETSHWIHRALKDFIRDNTIPNSICGTITCIPKAGKLRNNLKNWRPLTLLNCIYKFFSQIISERIKTTLNDLVHPDQTGFITGRYIGENTRLIFDVLHDFEFSNSNKNSLIMIIDYSKAFDMIEWNFINTCLKKFNFGDNLIHMVKLLERNSFSKVEQNGYFSQKNNVGKRV